MFCNLKFPILAVFLIAFSPNILPAQVTWNIDLTKGQSAISPFIYGVNTQETSGYANQGLDHSWYAGLNLTFQRLGGDAWTAYNYMNNDTNAGADYYYENTDENGGTTPGGAFTRFLQGGAAENAQSLITIPINGYVAADDDGSVNPAILPQNSTHFVPEFPTQADDPNPAPNHVYENNAVQIAMDSYTPAPGEPLAIELDNEPDIWNSTHPEVHPQPVTYAELLQKTIAYATMIKQVDPNAMVYGWGSYGYGGYTTLNSASDSAANGNFTDYYLSNMAAASATAGVRLLDSLELHWYPVVNAVNSSGQSVSITSDDISPAVVAARLQAPRSLWDPTYNENTWISQQVGGPIQLIPTLQQQIKQYYPGTKLSFGEYNYGAGYDISGGIAEADVLGIFGKYGVYSAAEWSLSNINDNFIDGAFQIYRNYDGNDSTFGDTEVQATNSDVADTSVYASVESTNQNKLTVVAINKEDQTVSTTISLADAANYKTLAIYQLTSGSDTPVFAGDMALTGSSFTYSMPAYSVSMLSFFVPGQTVGTWNFTGTGKWGTLTDWSGAPPQTAGDTANFTSAITANSTVRLTGSWSVGTMNFNNPTYSYTIGPGSGGTLTLDNGSGTAAINDLAGNHFITAPVVLNSNTIATVTSSGNSFQISGPISGKGGLTVAGSGNVTLSGSNTFTGGTTVSGTLDINAVAALPSAGALTIQNTGKVQLASGLGTLTVSSLAISTGGGLDLSNNELIINYTGTDPIATVAALIKTGYANGKWNGPGIFTSAAASEPGYGLGYADGSDGVVTGLNPGQIEIKYTLLGDANLDGEVNGTDFNLMATNFNQAVTSGWDKGDFNYDGAVNGNDFVLLAQNFNQYASQSAVATDDLAALDAFAAANGLLSDLPEPGIGAVVLVLAFARLGSRRMRTVTSTE